MPNPETEVKAQPQKPQPQMRMPVPCEVFYQYEDRTNHPLIVTVDQPMILPTGHVQCHLGDEMLILPPTFRSLKIKAIKQEEQRIITP
jgi:hypothetical protein